MNLANPELCKQLYELSGWNDEKDLQQEIYYYKESLVNNIACIPRYTLGYLLRKLPPEIDSKTIELVIYGGHWEAAYSGARDDLWNQSIKSHAADIPEDAVCKLAIELFKQGLL